jgi:hypothetical protein
MRMTLPAGFSHATDGYFSRATTFFFCHFKVNRNENINWEKEIRTV